MWKAIYIILAIILIHNSSVAQPSNEEPPVYTNETSETAIEEPVESIFIDNYVKSLENGMLLYNPPREMTINVTESLDVTIAKGNASGEPIKVAPYMEVTLYGSSFNIISKTANRQFIASDSPTTWKWDVTPKKEGNQILDLLAYVIIKMPDGHEERRALVKSKTIYVQVNPLEKQEWGGLIIYLFQGPWAKVITALSGLLAFLAIFFKEDILAWIRLKRKPPN